MLPSSILFSPADLLTLCEHTDHKVPGLAGNFRGGDGGLSDRELARGDEVISHDDQSHRRHHHYHHHHYAKAGLRPAWPSWIVGPRYTWSEYLFGVLNVSLRACGAQLRFNQPGTINDNENPPGNLDKPWKPTKNHEKPWNHLKKSW